MCPSRPSTRRDFLTGKSVAGALESRVQPAAGQDATGRHTAPPESAGHLIYVSRPAMACQFEICCSAEHYPDAVPWATAALDLVDRLEDQMSIYRDHSQLCEINRDAGSRAVVVEPRLFELLCRAQHIFQETGGAFDMTAGPLTRVWGFHQRAGRVPTDAELTVALAGVDSHQVQLDPQAHSITFLAPGIEINVNGIGKGYALDRGAELLRGAGMDNVLIHAGQSSVLAAGSHPATPGQGWCVGLRHPLYPDRRLAELFVQDRAVGTSGSGSQFFDHRGKRYGHVIDPRTGWPAEGVYSATVLAPTAAAADALATALYVLGPEDARQYCAAHPDIAMLLVSSGPKQGTVRLHRHGLQEGDWRLLDEDAVS